MTVCVGDAVGLTEQEGGSELNKAPGIVSPRGTRLLGFRLYTTVCVGIYTRGWG